MRWYVFTGLSLSALGLVAGCATGRPETTTPLPTTPPAPTVASSGDGASQARGQKPDAARPPASILALLRPPQAPPGPYTDAAGRIRAVVNGEVILEQEVKFTAKFGLSRARTAAEHEEVMQQALSHLIDRELVLQEMFHRLSSGPAKKFLDKLKEAAGKEFDKYLRRLMRNAKIKDEETFQKMLDQDKESLSLMRRGFERDFMAREFVNSQLDQHLQMIGHVQIQEYYDAHPEEFRLVDSVDWQDMFIAASGHATREAARRFAEVLAERVRQGEDFVALAAKWDKGDASLRKDAEGQGHKHGEISPTACENDLFQMKENEVRLVEIDGGYHVIRLVKREHAGPMPFSSAVQKQIKDKLRAEVVQREMKRIVTDLKRTAVIDVAPTGN